MLLMPMDFGQSSSAIRELHLCPPFELSPSSSAIFPPQPHNIPDSATDGYCFNFFDLTDNLEIHMAIVG